VSELVEEDDPEEHEDSDDQEAGLRQRSARLAQPVQQDEGQDEREQEVDADLDPEDPAYGK